MASGPTDAPVSPIPKATAPPTAAGRWRVEDLAAASDVSVDTIRFYQKRRLLPSPRAEGRIAWYDAAHLERLARIRDLRAQGLTLALIGRLLDGELDPADVPLAAAVAHADDAGEAGAPFLTLAELSEQSGVPLALLESVAHEGLLVPRVHEGEPRYTSGDVGIVRDAMRLLETGLPLPELMQLAREHHEMTRTIAEQAVHLFDVHVRTPLRASSLTDEEKADRLVGAFGQMLPAVTDLVAHHFRRVLLTVAQEHLEAVGEEHEIAAVQVESSRMEARR